MKTDRFDRKEDFLNRKSHVLELMKSINVFLDQFVASGQEDLMLF